MIALIPLPRQFYTVLTFPGIVVRQVVTQLVCRFSRLAIHDVCYLSVDDGAAGWVRYEPAPTVVRHATVTAGPWILCSLLGAMIGLPAVTRMSVLDVSSALDGLLIWLATSIAMHALPTADEAASLFAATERPGVSSWTHAWTLPLVGIMYVGVILSWAMEGLLYGLLVVFGVPAFVVQLLA